jgi:hypothetical protein
MRKLAAEKRDVVAPVLQASRDPATSLGSSV